MIDLGRHIEVLLLTNDCVIVPSLGGFVAHHVEARYDESDGTLLPPYRTLGFNPQLTINDSLLAQSYIEAFDISYPEAIRMIEDEVNELKQELRNTGRYTLDGIGKLSLNAEGRINFEPYEAGVLTPSLYGLGGITMPRIPDTAADKNEASINADIPGHIQAGAEERPIFSTTVFEREEAATEEPATEDSHERTINIKLSWVRNAVAVAAAVAAFFVLSTPISNSRHSHQAASNLHGTELLTKLIPQDANTPEVTLTQESEKATVSTTSAVQPKTKTMLDAGAAACQETESAKQTEQAITPVQKGKGRYCVVLASQIPLKNAEKLAIRLQKEGLQDCRVAVSNRMTRVVSGSYATEAEAYRHLADIRAKKQFEDAWIYRIP